MSEDASRSAGNIQPMSDQYRNSRARPPAAESGAPGKVGREALAALSEAAAPGPWLVIDTNEGTWPPRPGWEIVNDAYLNPPADEDAPWLAVELHTGRQEDADFIAALVNDYRASPLSASPVSESPGQGEGDLRGEVERVALDPEDVRRVAAFASQKSAAMSVSQVAALYRVLAALPGMLPARIAQLGDAAVEQRTLAARVEAAIRLLGDDEMTPVAQRQLRAALADFDLDR